MSFAAEPEKLKMEPYDVGSPNGFENMNHDTAVKYTHLLINVYSNVSYAYKEWKITFKNGENVQTVSLYPTSLYNFGDGKVLYRFQPVNATGENQFIPVVGVNYTVSFKIYDKETLLAYADEVSGFICGKDHQPILPSSAEVIRVEPWHNGSLKGMENWTGNPAKEEKQTTVILKVIQDPGVQKKVFNDCDWRITFSDGAKEQTVTLKCHSILAFDHISYRFQPCVGTLNPRFIPEVGKTYTVKAEILKDGVVIARSAEAVGGLVCQEEPIIFPAVPDPEPEPEPPVTGEQTPEFAVLSLLTLLGLVVALQRRKSLHKL